MGIWYKPGSIVLWERLFGFPLGLIPLQRECIVEGHILWLTLRVFGTPDEKYGRTRRVSELPVGEGCDIVSQAYSTLGWVF